MQPVTYATFSTPASAAGRFDTPFEGHVDFDPGGAFEEFLKQVPARWVVYLMADADDRPVQLLCVKNLRYSVKRRLGGELALGPAAAGPSKRVNYRDLVRRIHWRRVDSAFEADWVYYEAARQLFPRTYRGMVGFRPAWFVHVNPDANFPRYTKSIDLTTKSGVLIGPVEDKHAAARLMHLAEDAFDLCRYYNVLVEAPRGRACAYKEMGKCPAPCDGSVSMDQYRRLVGWSAAVLVDPADYVREQTRRMQAAAADLRFESAAKIKQYVEQLGQLGKGPFRHVRRLEDFRFLSLQHGPREGSAKAYLVTPGRIEEILGLRWTAGEPPEPAAVLRVAFERADAARYEPGTLDEAGAERIGVVSHHLFTAKVKGPFLALDKVDERAVAKALKDLQKHRPAEDEEPESEGVMKELQAL